ncbi:hypothetical protein J7T55_015808 [Diaporthe amygdali]|uniref:uncharacterized protein n=1 Tax=Phomopsis amygdali TaxID=1214568 RepID=UPI0022FE9C43|nr:uncharacterized protein J7T55_015808 [Diaporthe amygdali]KAJ0107342.1 hypothetical protein J7T55_015808 [Diaporthe amygdali]
MDITDIKAAASATKLRADSTICFDPEYAAVLQELDMSGIERPVIKTAQDLRAFSNAMIGMALKRDPYPGAEQDKAGKDDADVSIYAAPGRARVEDLAGLPRTYIDTPGLDLFRDENLRQSRVDGKQFIRVFPDMVMNGNERACESRAEVQRMNLSKIGPMRFDSLLSIGH